MIRAVAAIAAALLLAAVVVRTAIVRAWAASDPSLATSVWPGHPDAAASAAMEAIGISARSGGGAPPVAVAAIEQVARVQPLAIEPFLVHGVIAQSQGQRTLAERLFKAAERRDPRALPPHYFLADLYLRSGDSARGLKQLTRLSQLSGGSQTIAPFLAAYARDPAHWPAIRAVLTRDPGLADFVLIALAANPENLPAIRAIGGGLKRGEATPPWAGTMLEAMISKGDFRGARALWFSLVPGATDRGALVYDVEFSDSTAPPPFNWTLAESGLGLAERQPGGGLHVIFYGSQSGALARQLLLLPQGRYRLAMRVAGNPRDPGALVWSIACVGSDKPFASVPVSGSGALAGTFAVPPNCPAQWLSLDGRIQDVAGRSDITISGFALEAMGSARA